MTKLNVLALLGIVAVLGMAGCGKKKHARTHSNDRAAQVNRDHRAKKSKKARKAEREMRREERNMFAK